MSPIPPALLLGRFTSTSSELLQGETDAQYDPAARVGVGLIVGASFISLISLVYVFLFVIPRSRHFKSFSRTNVWGYFASLLVANLIQSIGSVMSTRWIVENAPSEGVFCTLQATLKQTGNVSAAVWSFLIAVHLFNLLFLRLPCTKAGFVATLIFGWAAAAVVVFIGPAVTQSAKGPYFGISGFWCWITREYPTEQFFLEYFVEFLSAGLGFIILSLVLLRVRGNLVINSGRWAFRWVARADSWKLSIGRDYLDSSMLKVCAHMMWYPITYTIVIVPIALARLSEFSGKPVPGWATILTDVLFVLNGFMNIMLLVITRRLFPDPDEMPVVRKKQADEVSHNTGVTPFTLTRSDSEYSQRSRSPQPPPLQSHYRDASYDSSSHLSAPEMALLPDNNRSRFSL